MRERRMLRWAAAGAALLLCAAAAAADDYDEGLKQFRYQKFADAVPPLERALIQAPGNHSTYEMLAASYAELRQFDKAIGTMQSAIDKGVGDVVKNLYDLGRIQQKKGSNADALASFGKALALQPGAAECLYQRGNTYYFLGDFPHAVADYEQFLAVAPKHRMSPEVARMIAALKGQIKAKEDQIALEEKMKQEAEAQRLAAEEKRKQEEAERKKLMDQIYASLNDASNEQTNLSAGSEDVKNKPADVVRED